MKNIRLLLSAVVTVSVAMTQATARADSASTILTFPTGSGANWDDAGGNFPIINAILSAPSGSIYNPGTSLDGYTNRNWSFLAQDPTGSLDVFYSSSLASGFTPSGYVPHVGDSIAVQGTYSPFSGIPEIANSTAHPLSIQYGSSGNPFASPVLTTIPTINVGTNGGGISLSGLGGTLLQLKGVTISGTAANWGVHTNVTGTITDLSGHSMTMFLWASSYSTCEAIAAAGGPVPTGYVDMTGFLSDFYNSTLNGGQIVAEFVPISIVPEPGLALNLCGLGAAAAWVCYRARKKA